MYPWVFYFSIVLKMLFSQKKRLTVCILEIYDTTFEKQCLKFNKVFKTRGVKYVKCALAVILPALLSALVLAYLVWRDKKSGEKKATDAKIEEKTADNLPYNRMVTKERRKHFRVYIFEHGMYS